MDNQELAKNVIESLLKQDDDELDFAFQSIAMHMKKHLDEEQQEELLDEINQIVTRKIKQAKAARRFDDARDQFLQAAVNPNGNPNIVQEGGLKFYNM